MADCISPNGVNRRQTQSRHPDTQTTGLAIDQIYRGDARDLLASISPASIALSVWSPPYFVGKSYEKDLTFEEWQELLATVIAQHERILKPGAFLVVNIADILCFADASIPRIQAENTGGHRLPVSREDVLGVLAKHPTYNRYQVAEMLGVSEQTVDRRMKNNNIRGGKYASQTRVQLVGGLVQEWAYKAGLYLYDRRVWVKDAAWQNSRWHTNSYRAVDEFEYLFFIWKPGITKIDRKRLSQQEWVEWGSRAVWHMASVRANDNHEAKFPLELPRRVIRLLTDPGDTVIDCFVGSGTSAVAALLEGRHFIGIDKLEKYVRLARRACTAAREKMGALGTTFAPPVQHSKQLGE
jgi:site-specific DNA-methyltransferase (adenine-specific)